MQKQLGVPITHKEAEEIRSFNPDFICFPEYFFVNKKLGNHGQTPHNFKRQLKRIEVLSRELDTVVIGGTMPEPDESGLFNTAFVYDRGKQLGFYRKQNLFFAEYGKITPGTEFKIFKAHNIKFGVLICADVFKDNSFIEMKRLGAEIIFVPTFSPKKEETPDAKFERDNAIFVKGARISDALIVKVCGVPSRYKEFLQARSLIADKNGVIYRVQPEEEDKIIIIQKEICI